MKNKNINYGLLTDTHVLAPEIRQSFNEHFEVKDASFARGRFAQVRRCVHKLTSAECAAKVMRKYRRAVDVSAEIMHEVRVLLMADKERHIVNLLQLYESTSEYILVLEMATGGELQHVLDDYDNIPEQQTKIMLRQLLNAVCFLHRNNIAHLDIKPQNILLSAPYPLGEVKLCDFGISRMITNDTELREIVGTADYVAPEILHYEPIFLTTDMWSIGILTYVMLTGYTPFGGETKQETFLNITQGTLDFPEDLFTGISELAIDFICKLLKKKPKQRLSSDKCSEHEWLTTIDEEKINETTTTTTTPTNQEAENEENSNSNSIIQIENEILKTDQLKNNQLNNQLNIQLNNQPSSQPIVESINQPINEQDNSFKQVKKDETIDKNLNNNIVIKNGLDSPLKPVNDKSISIPVDTTNCNGIKSTDLNGESNISLNNDKCTVVENNDLNKSADELNSDNHKNNQEILNTISTNNTTNELISTNCTNVTFLQELTAN